MKRKAGDKVKIKTDLVVGTFYNTWIDFATDMIKYQGKEGSILKVEDGYYKLDIDNKEWNWADDMLDDVSDFKNEQNTFDITKVKYIIKEQLNKRGFKTGDIVGDIDNIGIVYGDKVVYITAECTETINPKAYCEIIPVELIESKKCVHKALSQYLYESDYDLLERYFIKIKERDTITTKLYQVEFTYNSASLKNFISNDSEIKIGDIVECQCSLNSSNYQYCKVKNIIEEELTTDEIKLYRTCRRISL